MTVLLTAEQLTIGYGKQTVGRNISFALQSNEILALLGPNGSGKTTLFKTLLGLIKPMAGQVFLNEQVKQLRAKGLGVLLCTHQPEHALQIADRLALLKNGQLDKVGNLEEFGTAENLAWLSGVPVEQVYAQLKRDFVQ